jgi:hypothetical protein
MINLYNSIYNSMCAVVLITAYKPNPLRNILDTIQAIETMTSLLAEALDNIQEEGTPSERRCYFMTSLLAEALDNIREEGTPSERRCYSFKGI